MTYWTNRNGTEPRWEQIQTQGQYYKIRNHKNYLHQFFHHISAQYVVEHSLKELISDDGKFQLVTMPNQYSGFFHGSD
jgi:hypothetical protein